MWLIFSALGAAILSPGWVRSLSALAEPIAAGRCEWHGLVRANSCVSVLHAYYLCLRPVAARESCHKFASEFAVNVRRSPNPRGFPSFEGWFPCIADEDNAGMFMVG